MATVQVQSGDGALAELLDSIGRQRYLDALGELVDDYEEAATYVIDDAYMDNPDEIGGEEVWLWALIRLHRTASTVGALIEAVVPIFSRHQGDDEDDEDADDDAPGFKGAPAYLRLTLEPRARDWTVLSGQYLPHDAIPYRAEEPPPGVIECPLCHEAPAAEILYGLPDPETERRAVAAGMIFGGDELGPETFGITHACRICGFRWGEDSGVEDPAEPEPARDGPPRTRAEAAQRARDQLRTPREPPGPTS